MRIEKASLLTQAWGDTPISQNVWGVLIWSGLNCHIHKGFLNFGKNFWKKFGKYKNYILPLAGGWVCLYKKMLSIQISKHNIA
jgi:hypothetical protein